MLQFCASEGIQIQTRSGGISILEYLLTRSGPTVVPTNTSPAMRGLILILSPLPAAAITLAFGKPTDDGVINQIIDGAYLVDAET